ncbi:MAG: hypothetical protein ACOCTN_04735 [Candidatus Natronoplasma sp.]
MKLKLAVLSLSERLKWKNWPTWFKGFFLLWPSLGPVYLFLTRTPAPTGGEAELNTIMTNLEYQNYFIVVFIGFWSINLVLLGMTWIIGSLISDGYRSYLKEKSSVKMNTSSKVQYPKQVKKQSRRYPVLVKKGTKKSSSAKITK